jgi:hypothetical protein
MVIVDTLEKVRAPRSSSPYADDYAAEASLQSLLAGNGTVLAVHHNRKNESDDFLDDVSGTLGLAGSVDTVITLKRKRTEVAGTLSVTGRDVDEMVYKVVFADGKWKADGTDLSDAARRATEDRFSEKMRAVLELVNSRASTTAPETAAVLEIPEATARKYLSRLAVDHGLIQRTATGTYGPVTVSQVSRDDGCAGSTDESSCESGCTEDVAESGCPSQDELAATGV